MFIKILSLFSAFTLFATGAVFAAPDQRTECIVPNYTVSYTGTPGRTITADYAIFFDNNSSTIPKTCTNEIEKKLSVIKQRPNDIETILLLGSADGAGNRDGNANLGRNRAEAVRNLLENSFDITICQDGKNDRCANLSMGEAMASSHGAHYSDKDLRAVYMFVINKTDICTQSTIKILDYLIEKTSGAVKTQLTNAKGPCTKDGAILLRSQREQIDSAISAALDGNITIQNDTPSDIKIYILAHSLDNTRTAFMSGTSVWKDKDGKFNFARLASDSIAGVVLGTAGGLITSHVVKKSQLSKGFDNVMCKIGGQTVASYGDTFTVGITTK